MPSSIPFDHPSLVLGNIVDPNLLAMLKSIGNAQAKIDAAQDKMNALLAMKRGLSMTMNELIGMNVSVDELNKRLKDVDQKIQKAATDYITIRLVNEDSIQATKEKITELTTEEEMESPLDYERTKIKPMPLAADSLKLDAQYFSYESNTEDMPTDTTSSIEDYIKETTASLGPKASNEMAKTVGSQIRLQRKKHSIAGTLIIAANCTHKNASVLAPLVLDPDKCVDVWNQLHKDDRINTSDVASLEKMKDGENLNEDKSITLLSGVTYGSSFVGMVHVLNTESLAEKGASMSQLAESLQERFTIGGWMEDSSGGLGVDPGFSDDIRRLLSTQNITSHINVAVMGCIPSIKSNQIEMGVRTLAGFDEKTLSQSLSVVENVSQSEKKTIKTSSESARKGAKVMAIRGATVQNVISGLGKIDQKSNQMLDINSLMVAFEDYLKEIKTGSVGVPINFYFKKITQARIVQLWTDKYYPDTSSNTATQAPETPTKKTDK
ncbi:MAG: hypothetical protein R2792_03210 [Saprospiraceae bacterium]